jgi:hypothetical protein
MSAGEGREDPEAWPDCASLCNALLMSLSAELKAPWSDELIVPAETSDASSFWSRSNGDWNWD